MICQKCKDTHQVSKVFVEENTVTDGTDDEFYDEEGLWHSHRTAIINTSYRCSNGHIWYQVTRNRCSCGWAQSLIGWFLSDGTRWLGGLWCYNGGVFTFTKPSEPVTWRELTDEELITRGSDITLTTTWMTDTHWYTNGVLTNKIYEY